MRFLIDAHLPPMLAAIFRDHGHESVHLFDIAPRDADDRVIWKLGNERPTVIVTKDEDFAALAKLFEKGPQVLWLRIGNCSKSYLRKWIEPRLPVAFELLKKGERLVIVI
jgi:predicted nuclease of predicted toxin-antitoxin system